MCFNIKMGIVLKHLIFFCTFFIQYACLFTIMSIILTSVNTLSFNSLYFTHHSVIRLSLYKNTSVILDVQLPTEQLSVIKTKHFFNINISDRLFILPKKHINKLSCTINEFDELSRRGFLLIELWEQCSSMESISSYLQAMQHWNISEVTGIIFYVNVMVSPITHLEFKHFLDNTSLDPIKIFVIQGAVVPHLIATCLPSNCTVTLTIASLTPVPTTKRAIRQTATSSDEKEQPRLFGIWYRNGRQEHLDLRSNFESPASHLPQEHPSAKVNNTHINATSATSNSSSSSSTPASRSLGKSRSYRIGNISPRFRASEDEVDGPNHNVAVNVTSLIPPLGNQNNKGQNVINSEDALLNRSSVLFVAVSFILLMFISLAWLVFYYVQRFRYLHSKERASRRLAELARKAVARIPLKLLRAGDKEIGGNGEHCAICIEPYRPFDNIRILPCRHYFHKVCIDPWLLEQRSCPMCKLDILQAYDLRPYLACSTGEDSSLFRGGPSSHVEETIGQHLTPVPVTVVMVDAHSDSRTLHHGSPSPSDISLAPRQSRSGMVFNENSISRFPAESASTPESSSSMGVVVGVGDSHATLTDFMTEKPPSFSLLQQTQPQGHQHHLQHHRRIPSDSSNRAELGRQDSLLSQSHLPSTSTRPILSLMWSEIQYASINFIYTTIESETALKCGLGPRSELDSFQDNHPERWSVKSWLHRILSSSGEVTSGITSAIHKRRHQAQLEREAVDAEEQSEDPGPSARRLLPSESPALSLEIPPNEHLVVAVVENSINPETSKNTLVL